MNILQHKYYNEESVFKPENLLREAKRQKKMQDCKVPPICLLDPDGDILEYLLRTGQATINHCWSCYHTKMYSFDLGKFKLGIIGCAVGASFAVLIAEQLFVSGCTLLLSITSSGIISDRSDRADYILIRDAIRDEGTSYHYLKPGQPSTMHIHLLKMLCSGLLPKAENVAVGTSWTTDAPYRETGSAIESMKIEGADVVEMEAAALYAFGIAKNKEVICFAHITNSMAQQGDDFEKGQENGSLSSLALIGLTLESLSGK
ncbi:nucleoside phosphorylase [Arachidicoccus ginsenosidivorans]|uniref:Nucleoside phosphorylase n=2 Tax=Arachidicoccus ginsenosidivorans TaxID=496057 RepID=A0A5B8VU91_9BACT|nr:nucleoside phosphorylase [Arachidicoccus ginsenosidivorans]